MRDLLLNRFLPVLVIMLCLWVVFRPLRVENVALLTFAALLAVLALHLLRSRR